MSKTHFPRSGGQQWADSFYRYGHPTGNVFYVHSGGSATGPGYSPETAYSTIDAAIGACTADNGDVIVVLEDHAETITGAAGIALDIAGVKILGLGEGRRRPRITFGTDAAASCDISGARCVVDNVVFLNAIDAQTAMINVTAADVVIQNCEVALGDGTTQAVLGVLTTDAADRLKILNCHFHGSSDAGYTGAIRLVGGEDIHVRGNHISGQFATTGALENVTTAGENWLIEGNFILNTTADGDNKAIVLVATTTGIIANNRLAVIDSTSPAPVTAAGAYVSGNYSTGAAGVTASTLM